MKLMSLLSVILGLIAGSGEQKDLQVEYFASLLGQGNVALVDVRTAEEYSAGHIPGATNVDFYSEDFLRLIEASIPKDCPVAVYCRTGKRSAEASAALAKAGYTVNNLIGGFEAWKDAGLPVNTYQVERFFSDSHLPVDITLVKHGTLAISFKGNWIHVDPVSGLNKPTVYSAEFPKADAILITHEHGDHLDEHAIDMLSKEGTRLVMNYKSWDKIGHGDVMENGERGNLPGRVIIVAVPAYNISSGHEQFHPKGNGNGYVLSLDGFRIYIAGDTEDIPEMAQLEDIDLAFLPVNQPYTMTVEQCVRAAKSFMPKVLIPYHFSQTDISSLPAQLPDITVLLRDMQ